MPRSHSNESGEPVEPKTKAASKPKTRKRTSAEGTTAAVTKDRADAKAPAKKARAASKPTKRANGALGTAAKDTLATARDVSPGGATLDGGAPDVAAPEAAPSGSQRAKGSASVAAAPGGGPGERVRAQAYLLAEANGFAGDPGFYWAVAERLVQLGGAAR